MVDVFAQLESIDIAYVSFATRGANKVEATNYQIECFCDFRRNFLFFFGKNNRIPNFITLNEKMSRSKLVPQKLIIIMVKGLLLIFKR